MILPALTPATLKSAPGTRPNALSNWILYVPTTLFWFEAPVDEHQEGAGAEHDQGDECGALHGPVGTWLGLHW